MNMSDVLKALELLDDSFRLTHVILLVTRSSGEVLYMNAAAREAFGEAMERRLIFEAFPAVCREAVREHVTAILSGGQEEQRRQLVTWPLTMVSGLTRRYTWSIHLIEIPGQTGYSLLWVGLDVTEHDRLRERFHTTYQCYQILFERSPIGIVRFDAEGRVTDVNPAAVSILGTRSEMLMEMNLFDLPNQEVVTAVRRVLDGETVQLTGTYYSVTGRKVTPGRATFVPEKDAMGQCRGGIILIEDWTHLRTVESAYQESERRFYTLTDTLGAAVFIRRDRFLYVNPAMVVMTGWSKEELLQMELLQLVHPDDRHQEALAHVVDESVCLELKVVKKNGAIRWVELVRTPVLYRDAPAEIGVMFDITELKQIQRDLQIRVKNEQFLLDLTRLFIDPEKDSFDDLMLEALHRVYTWLGLHRIMVMYLEEPGSSSYRQIRVTAEGTRDMRAIELSGDPEWVALVEGADRQKGIFMIEDLEPAVVQSIERFVDFVKDRSAFLPLYFRNETFGFMIVEFGAEVDSDHAPFMRPLVMFAEILSAALAHNRTERQRHRLASILEATTDLVAIADRRGRTLYLNEAGRRMLNLPAQFNYRMLNLTSMRPAWAQDVIKKQAIPEAIRNGVWEGETAFLSLDGREIPVSQVILAHRDAAGIVRYLSTIARDISDRKEQERRLVHLASFDALTNVYNRRRFEEELDHHLAQVRRFGGEGVLMVIDIDDFKYINESLGHRAGDEILRHVASMIRVQMRDTDVIARIGGDEFAVLMPHTQMDVAYQFAREIGHHVRRQMIVIKNQPLHITVSIGLVQFPDYGDHSEVLLPRADLAKYFAKAKGKGSICPYTEEIERSTAVRHRLEWRTRIQRALHEGHFFFVLQPIVDVRTGMIHAYEALIRLREGDETTHLPGEFLSIADHFGLTLEIDRWVVNHAMQLLKGLQDRYADLAIHVNLSSQALMDPGFPDEVLQLARELKVNPSAIVFELTETMAISNMNQVTTMIHRLRREGFRFAIDDFGAGFSSFYYLRHLEVDFIKIDGSYILRMVEDPIDKELVKTLNDLSHRLHKQTIAEFVGDQPTFDMLHSLGIDHAQGAFISMPGQIEEVLAVFAPGRVVVDVPPPSARVGKDPTIKPRD